MLLYRTARFRRVTDGLRFYGRMSLTNYIAQSVVGALIFFPFGLGLASRCGYALSLVIGVVALVRIGVHILRQQGDGVPDRDDTFDKLVNWVIGIFLGAGAVATGRDRWKVSGTV